MARKTKNAEQTNGAVVEKPKVTHRKPAGRKTSVRSAKKKANEVTDDAIRLRAYFISQDRRRHGLSADPNSDWIEARRQLLEEASAASSAG